MGTRCSCMTNAPKEHRVNIDFPSDQESSNDFISALMGSASSRPVLSNTHSCANKNYTRTLKDRNYLIQMLKATDIPSIHSSNGTHLYIVLKVVDIDTNTQKGLHITSLHRISTTNPIWNCYRTFKASEFHDKLLFEIWIKYMDDDEKQDAVIGCGEVKISEGFVNVDDHHTSNANHSGQLIVTHDTDNEDTDEDEQCLQEVVMHLDEDKYQNIHNIKLYFKLFALQRSPDASIEPKTIFFIPSKSESLNVEEMKHAMKLNEIWKAQKKEDLPDFLSSQVIYSSPFCSSAQTAILSLLDHPCLDRRGIQFVSGLREIKMDGMQHKTRHDPFQHAINNIHKCDALNEFEAQINRINIEFNDCDENQKWWKCCVDTKQHFEQRLQDFMYFIRYSSESSIICVGHRLWFDAFLKQYVNNENMKEYTDKEVIEQMIENKIFEQDHPAKNGIIHNENGKITDKSNNTQNESEIKRNAQCFRINIAFSDQFTNGLEIEDIQLLFGKT